jgi:hypothetical protein
VSVGNWLPVVVAVIGILGATVTYALQKRFDRNEDLRAEKKKAYRAFLDALFEHAEQRTEQSRKAYDHSKIALLLVAPDAVLKRLVVVQETATMDMNATGPGDVHATVTDLIVEMRKDCFDRSKLVNSELEYVVPIGRPTPLTAEPEGHYEP